MVHPRLRLHAIRDGEVYATRGRTVYRGAIGGSLSRCGRVPAPPRADPVTAIIARYPVTQGLSKLVGRFATLTLRPIDDRTLLATSWGWVYRSSDGGRNWHRCLQLAASSPPFGVLPSAICAHDGRVFLGEYPGDGSEPAHLYRSDDGGRTWTAERLDEVRHIHSVTVDPYDESIWLTTGDRDVECRLIRRHDGDMEVIGGGSQDWRAVEPTFTRDGVLWGVDCAYRRQNQVYLLPRSSFGDGRPRAVHTTDSSVYYAASATIDGDQWVAFSTAAEAGTDSTAPGRQTRSGPAAVIAACESDGFSSWTELLRLDRRRSIADYLRLPGVPTANAYIFLETDGGSIIANPFNTTACDGSLIELDLPS